jgi:ubiquinone/menaquinone biosynthesis C-methylase UbiE
MEGVGGATKAIDPVDFREAQHKHWDSAAVGWMEWSEFNDNADRHISERLVELAGVQSGSRVLDVAAGYGEPALTAARKAGPEGRVVATDISSEMLAFGRERATAAGLGNLEFMESDASSLDFPHASFDAAVSRWGIIFEPDAEAAARRIRRFLKPGGRIAISSWGEPDQVTFQFESPEDFTTYIRAISAPIRAMIEQHAGEAQEEAWDAITQAAADASGGSKPLSFSNVVLLASATA